VTGGLALIERHRRMTYQLTSQRFTGSGPLNSFVRHPPADDTCLLHPRLKTGSGQLGLYVVVGAKTVFASARRVWGVGKGKPECPAAK
jgi:hypothetical protein